MPLIEKAKQITAKKGQSPVSALTAYDYSTARLLDEAGVDVLLVVAGLDVIVFWLYFVHDVVH